MTTEEKIIKNKLGLLRLAEELGNVSQACRIMGYSRDNGTHDCHPGFPGDIRDDLG